MGLKIVAKKRFLNNFKKITAYLKQDFGKSVADDFNKIVLNKLDLIAVKPNIGTNTAIKNTKSVLAGKGFQNRIYYRVEENKLIILNLKDIRRNPKQNRYHQ